MIRLETAANASIVCMAVLTTAFIARQWIGQAIPPAADAPYAVGEDAPSIPSVVYSKVSRTVLLVVGSGCHYCTESMPFYKRLALATKENRGQLVAVGSETEPVLRQYLSTQSLVVDAVANMTPQTSRVRATPTLMVVDSRGKIVRSWQGKLASAQEKELVRDLRKAGAMSGALWGAKPFSPLPLRQTLGDLSFARLPSSE